MTIVNVEMAAAWDGDEGDDWAENADRYEATGRWIWARFEQEVEVAPTDAVLDVGCGTGASTRSTAQRAPGGRVLGVDLSTRMLEEARRRATAEGLTNVEFLRADAQVHPFDAGSFDLAISDYGAMFFAGRAEAFANMARALRPGGRLALLAWRPMAENEWLTAIREALALGRELPAPPTGAPGPFGLAEPEPVLADLRAAGFGDVAAAPLDEPMWIGKDVEDAWAFVSSMGLVGWLTSDLDDGDRDRALATLRAVVEAHDTPEGVAFGAASWLYTATKR